MFLTEHEAEASGSTSSRLICTGNSAAHHPVLTLGSWNAGLDEREPALPSCNLRQILFRRTLWHFISFWSDLHRKQWGFLLSKSGQFPFPRTPLHVHSFCQTCSETSTAHHRCSPCDPGMHMGIGVSGAFSCHNSKQFPFHRALLYSTSFRLISTGPSHGNTIWNSPWQTSEAHPDKHE
jgi:hypothetical protein